MVSLKYTKEERAGEKKEREVNIDAPDYPYGLCLYLDTESMKKLGLNPMAVGSEVTFMAKGYVKSRSEHENENMKTESSLSIQITDMEVDKTHDSDIAKRFYENKEE